MKNRVWNERALHVHSTRVLPRASTLAMVRPYAALGVLLLATSTRAGSLVTLALNGEAFGASGAPLYFEYVGTSPPVLFSAHFEPDGTRLIVRFDGQPTNRGGMLGDGPCAAILDAATVAVLQGSSQTALDCGWDNDFTLSIYLTMFTGAAPGVIVGTTRANVLWPAAWEASTEYTGSCNVADTLCAATQTVAINSLFPCDDPFTSAVREQCIGPTAIIAAPREISSCESTTSLQLDGASSTGSGIKSLTYTPRALPAGCDNFYRINPFLANADGTSTAAGSAATTTLTPAELSGGSLFIFTLTVTNFLGYTSDAATVVVQRNPLPIPSVVTLGPPNRIIPYTQTLPIEGKAGIASCFVSASSRRVTFAWSVDPRTPLRAPLAITNRRKVQVPGASLMPNVPHILTVVACVLENPNACGYASTNVPLLAEPLTGGIKGGNRTVGEASAFTVSACGSNVPADLNAQCDKQPFQKGGSCVTLAFQWDCSVGSSELRGSSDTACSYSAPAMRLPPGMSTFRVVTQTLTGESFRDLVAGTVLAGALPAVSMEVVTADGAAQPAKLDTTAKLRLQATVLGATEIVSFQWSMTPPTADLMQENVTSTGVGSDNRTPLPNVLQKAATYTFEVRALTATRSGSSIATMTFLTSRPPYGGSLYLEYTSPVLAVETTVRLVALARTHGADDLPLQYAFAYRARYGDSRKSILSPEPTQRAMESWRPTEGNWSVRLYVYDALDSMAEASAPLDVEPKPLTLAQANQMFSVMEQAGDEGDMSAGIRAAQALSTPLASVQPADSTDAGSEDAIDEAQVLSMRDNLLTFIASGGDQAMDDPQLAQQSVVTTSTVVSGTCSSEGLDSALGIIDRFANLPTTDAAPGTNEAMLNTMASVLGQGKGASARRRRARALSETNQSAAAAAAADASEADALAAAALRSARLVNSTFNLANSIASSIVLGAPRVTISTPALAIIASQELPCTSSAAGELRKEDSIRTTPVLENGLYATFYATCYLPPETLWEALKHHVCPSDELVPSSANASAADALVASEQQVAVEGEEAVQVIMALFMSNTHAAADPDDAVP